MEAVMYGCRYKISLLKPSVKALMVSTRTSVRMDTRGFLSMQYMIRLDDGQICFAEYFVSLLSIMSFVFFYSPSSCCYGHLI